MPYARLLLLPMVLLISASTIAVSTIAVSPLMADAPCPLTLVDVAGAQGIDFVHDRGARGDKHLPETMGSGVAWLDADGDGWLDLYVVQSGPVGSAGAAARTNRLYRNTGRGFTAMPAGAGAGDTGYGQGAVAGDLDGDGRVDLYVTNDGADTLLRNRADGTFENATAAAFGTGLGGWSASAALADADADGDLDLYVVRYLRYDRTHELFCGDFETDQRAYCGPELFAAEADAFYRNRGDGTFEEVSASAGLRAVTAGKGLGVLFTDLDGDRLPDLYVANDQTVNMLFRNRGDGTFEELGLLSGTAVNEQGHAEAGMGVAVGDVDGDGHADLAVTNFDVETNTLYRHLGALQYLDTSVVSGFGLPSFNRLGFGLVLVDLDRDGALDAYVANGHVRESPRRENVGYAQEDLVLLGDGTGRFVDGACALEDAAEPRVGRGLAWADFDHDGDPDLALANSGEALQLLENASTGGWLGLDVRDARGAPAIGAEATVRTDRGTQHRRVIAGDSYLSSSDPRLLFGLGGATVREVTVTWPSGERRRLVAPPPDRYLLFREAN